jgi:calcineurin-like phosphoesterase family protein
MPGKKILVLGNHDRGRSLTYWYDIGFDEVYKYPIIYDEFYILSHESIYINHAMPYVNIHGHTHSENTTNLQKINVSVECTGYKPVLLDTITSMFNEGSTPVCTNTPR